MIAKKDVLYLQEEESVHQITEDGKSYLIECDKNNPDKTGWFVVTALKLMETLTRGHVVSYEASCRCARYGKKRLFRKAEEPVVLPVNDTIKSLQQQLDTPNRWYTMAYDKDCDDNFNYYTRDFIIVEERLDFIMMESFAEVIDDFRGYIAVFADSEVSNKDKSAAEIVDIYSSKDPMIFIILNMVTNCVQISVDNIDYLSEQLIEVIKKVALDNDKILEINI